eukprot:s1410_g5.t1
MRAAPELGFAMDAFWVADKELGCENMALAVVATGKGSEDLLRCAKALAQESGPCECFEADEAAKRFPQLPLMFNDHVAVATSGHAIGLGFGSRKELRARAAHLALALRRPMQPSSHLEQLVEQAKLLLERLQAPIKEEPTQGCFMAGPLEEF